MVVIKYDSDNMIWQNYYYYMGCIASISKIALPTTLFVSLSEFGKKKLAGGEGGRGVKVEGVRLIITESSEDEKTFHPSVRMYSLIIKVTSVHFVA